MKEKKAAREERNQEKLANADWVMAEFYATWCPHCQRMKPVVEEFKKLMEKEFKEANKRKEKATSGIKKCIEAFLDDVDKKKKKMVTIIK